MTENRPNSKLSRDRSQESITGDEAIDAVNEAMAILPKKRLGCLRRIAKYCAVLAVLLTLFVYWNFLRTPRLRISEETTYITQPLTSDGRRVDYFAAFEQTFYPPGMKTDDNGYRLIVRALGDVSDHQLSSLNGNDVKCDAGIATAQVYQKLGLDPAIKPTMTHERPFASLTDYVASQGGQRESAETLARRLSEPWTLDEFPMMESWLEENGPILDLLGQAVRKPEFCMPLVRHHPEAPLFEAIALGQIHRMRAFARSIEARANYRIATGDIDGAIDDAITQKRLGRHIQRQGTAVELLLGIAIEGMADAIGVAGNRESQPTNVQLCRFVDALRAVPPLPGVDRFRLASRYHTLAGFQAMAHDRQLFEDEVSIRENSGANRPGITTNLTLDWNVIMRQANASYDDPNYDHAGFPPLQRSLSDIFLGARSRRVADYLIGFESASHSACLEARRRTDCSGNLRRISLAMLTYEHEHGSLPPAFTADASGQPLHSWRVLLLPHLDEETLFAKIRLDEPWYSKHNRQFHDAMPAIYQCPSAILNRGETAYSVVAGESTPFQLDEGRSLNHFTTNLVLVVERWKPVCWMDPASELTEAIASEGVKARSRDTDGIGCEHPGGVMAALRNGSSRYIPTTLEPSVLQSLVEGTAESWPE